MILRCELEVPGYLIYATGDAEAPWVVFSLLWFDARCGVLKARPLTGWSVRPHCS